MDSTIELLLVFALTLTGGIAIGYGIALHDLRRSLEGQGGDDA